MPQQQVIDNTNLINMCRDCGAGSFVPALNYTYDAGAAEVEVEDASTWTGDGIDKIKIAVHDMFGNEVRGVITVAAATATIDVSTLNRSKPLAITAHIYSDNKIAADGSAHGIEAAGSVGFYDVQKNA